MRAFLSLIAICLLFVVLSEKAQETPVMLTMTQIFRLIDCEGHKGRNTVCVKNYRTAAIKGLRCGSHPITIPPHVGIPAQSVAAAIDLDSLTATCLEKGVTVSDEDGNVFNVTLDGTDINDVTTIFVN